MGPTEVASSRANMKACWDANEMEKREAQRKGLTGLSELNITFRTASWNPVKLRLWNMDYMKHILCQQT